MNGRTHKKIAMLSYAIVATVPAINSFPLFNNNLIHVNQGISLVGLGVAALAGLIVDADTQHSKISHMNPVTETALGAIGIVENILKTIVRILIGIGLAWMVLKYSETIIKELSTIKSVKPYATLITYLMPSIFIFSGIANERIMKSIPVVSFIYKGLANGISSLAVFIKRIAMFLIYACSGVILIGYNISHVNDVYLYIIAVLLIAIAIFPHRTFLHSLEGAAIFTISISYLLNMIGYKELTGCFFIGYMSHIYWADIFTKEGVPLFSTPGLIGRVFKKMHLHNKVIVTLEKIGDFKLKLPPHISTGSMMGNLFENIYVMVLLLIVVIAYIKFGTAIRLV